MVRAGGEVSDDPGVDACVGGGARDNLLEEIARHAARA